MNFVGMSQAEDNFSSTTTPILQQKDVYRELRLRGYQYGGLFQGIVKADLAGEYHTGRSGVRAPCCIFLIVLVYFSSCSLCL